MTRWQHVNGIYQIYPRSFKDANGDGVGDLRGIIQKLDYIKGGKVSLGIDAIWISPFFTSPMADYGYDVSDYYDVDPTFGTLDDFKELLHEAHKRTIKVMIDYVPNHTSWAHPWFVESRRSKDSAKRNWYVWHDPKPDGSPPNNWLSVFGGSAWEFDEATGQYYLHSFLKEQPDLNWDNPDVRSAMTDVLDFWLSLGVDGIRADAVRWLSKDLTLLEDNPPNPNYKEGDDPYSSQLTTRSRYGDSLYEYLRQIGGTVAKYPDRIILFEDYIDPQMNREAQYINMYSVYPKVAAPFNVEGTLTQYSAAAFRAFIDNFEELSGGDLRPFYCFGNHDQPRLATRVGEEGAKLIAMLQLTLPGIPVIYYGDELGMHNVQIPPQAVRDPFEHNVPGLGRDPERTPMQWSDQANGGFSTITPWLPLPHDYTDYSVAREISDPYSSLNLYRTLLKLRKNKALHTGHYGYWQGENEHVFGFTRRIEDEEFLIVLNMSDKQAKAKNVDGAVIYSTHSSVAWAEGNIIALEPNQGVILRRHIP
ncbi:MAG TPA: alpha-amylase family glycosyl hydrolase [Candidatus Saccharimonadales bacterium]